MSEIKSALEIALERTKSVEGNKEAVEADKYQREGKVLISKFLDDPDFNLKGSLGEYDNKQLGWVKEGMTKTLLANLVLPVDQSGLKKIKRIGDAFSIYATNTKILGRLFSQLESFFEEYLGEKNRYLEALEKQYAPRLKQKEDELSKKLGQPVHLNAESDPEFVGLMRKTMAQLEEKYGEVLNRAKNNLAGMFNQ